MNPAYFESELQMPMGMVELPVRCTVVKLKTGETIMISPIDFTPVQIAEIHGLGPITHIIAPSLIHHIWFKKAVERFRPRETWGPPRSREVLTDLTFTHVFGLDRWPFDLHLPTLFIEGVPRLNEMVFYHEASKTLICADLVFNLQNPKGWGAPLMLRMMGTFKRFGVSRLQARHMKDKHAFEGSMREILKWNFENIAMGHGDLVMGNGRERLQLALRERRFAP